jgi:hypothetical protein
MVLRLKASRILAVGTMAERTQTPFDNIDSAREYVGLLAEALEEARAMVERDVAEAEREGAARRLEALRMVILKLDGLRRHLDTSHRLLNDLRTLRRLLLRERRGPRPPSARRSENEEE